MNKALRIIGIIVAVIILAASLLFWMVSAKNSAKPEVSQNTPYSHAMSDKKPFVMMFHSDWCAYCQKVMPLFQTLSKEYDGKYNFVLLNIDDKSLEYVVNDYMPTSIPQLYIVDPTINARIMVNSALFSYPDKLRGELNRYLRIRSMIKQK